MALSWKQKLISFWADALIKDWNAPVWFRIIGMVVGFFQPSAP
jgi:hypothetical protein